MDLPSLIAGLVAQRGRPSPTAAEDHAPNPELSVSWVRAPLARSARRARPAGRGHPRRASASLRVDAYIRAGLQRVREVQQRAHALITRRKQEVALRNFADWLVMYGEGHTALDCTVEQLLVYITVHWVLLHGQYGQPARVKSTLGQLSHLSTQFCHLGRGSMYDELSCTGNPCHSVDVQLYRRGLTRGAVGEEEVSAVPLSYAKYRQLVGYLRAQIHMAIAAARLLLLRDLVCFSMWETAARGHDCGKLQLTDFRDPRNLQRPYGDFPLPLPGPSGGYPDRFQLVLSQLGTKTYQGVRAQPVVLAPAAEPELCLVRALAEYVQACGAPDAPPGSGLTGYLFRPLRPNHTGFREAPSGLTYRLRQHLQQAGLYDGETCHSFRRGSLQFMEAAGAETAALLTRGKMCSTATLRRYLDPMRHLPVAAPAARPDGD